MEDNRIKVTSMPAQLTNLNLDPLINYKIDVIFEGHAQIKPFSFDMIQSNMLNQRIGGEQFLFPGNGVNSLPREKYQKFIFDEDFVISPNPSAEYFKLQLKKPVTDLALSIISLDGREIYREYHNQMKKGIESVSIEWPLGSLSGIYFLKLSYEGKSKTLKIVKY